MEKMPKNTEGNPPQYDDLRMLFEPTIITNQEVNIEMDNRGEGDDDRPQPPTYVYRPYIYRNVDKPTTYVETLLHLLKASLGTGILAMPSAFKNAGYINGIVGTLLIGSLCSYTIHLLLEATYEQCVRNRRPQMTFQQVVYASFKSGSKWAKKTAKLASLTTSGFLYFYQIGTSTVYIIFICNNVKDVLDYTLAIDVPLRFLNLLLLGPLLIMSSIGKIKSLTPYSAGATVLTIVSFLFLFYYMLQHSLSLENRSAFGTMEKTPMFFGIVLFAMEAIGTILPLENKMAKPQQFTGKYGVLNVALVPITLLYTMVGLVGYLKYGDNTSGSITMDLPKTEYVAMIIKVFLAISIFFCYSLSNLIAFEQLWNGYLVRRVGSRDHSTLWNSIFRILQVLLTFGLSMISPDLEYLISVIGTLCLSTMGLLMPILVHYFTFSNKYRNKGLLRFVWYVFCCIAIVLLSVFGLVAGLYSNYKEIKSHFNIFSNGN